MSFDTEWTKEQVEAVWKIAADEIDQAKMRFAARAYNLDFIDPHDDRANLLLMSVLIVAQQESAKLGLEFVERRRPFTAEEIKHGWDSVAKAAELLELPSHKLKRP